MANIIDSIAIFIVNGATIVWWHMFNDYHLISVVELTDMGKLRNPYTHLVCCGAQIRHISNNVDFIYDEDRDLTDIVL